MLPEEIRKRILDIKNDGKLVSEISKALWMKYDTVRFIVKPVYEKQNFEQERPQIINTKSKKTINECVKRLKAVGKESLQHQYSPIAY